MKIYKKHPNKPLFDKKQGEIFVLFIDDVQHKKIAQLCFVDGMKNLEVAEIMNYSVRQIERIRIDIMKTVLKKLIEKQIPKKPLEIEGDYTALYGICPNCKNMVCDNEDYKYCNKCGQALDWGDTE